MAIEHPNTARHRIIPALICLLVLLAFIVDAMRGAGTPLENAGGMLRYFTIWGNVATACALLPVALGRRASPIVLAPCITALAIIALVYWGLLAGDHHPEGLGILTNHIFHSIVPVLGIGWWLFFVPRTENLARAIPAIMALPLAYGAFAFVLGELTGFYAYFFLELPRLGWAGFLANNAGLALFFAATGLGLLTLQRIFDRGR